MIINRNNYEEYFLLYIDRELNRDEQLMVEDFVRLHPDLEKEFNLLKQTIALPPVVVLEGKDKLLKEEKKKRVLPLYWLRVAASLLIVLTGAWFWLMSTGKITIRENPHEPRNSEVATNLPGGQKENPVPGTTKESHDAGAEKVTVSTEPSNKGALIPGAGGIAGTERVPGIEKVAKTEGVAKTERIVKAGGVIRTEGITKTEKTISLANLPGKKTYHPVEEKTPEENVASVANPPNALNQPLPVELSPATATTPPSTVNRQPSTLPDRTLTQNNQSPDDSQSILVFNNNNKAVPGFFKKLLSRSPDKEIAADSRQRKIKISVFQFNISK